MKKVLIIDNYDSFTYNLYQSIGEILEALDKPFRLDVSRNDEITLQQIVAKGYNRLIISPGPGDPSDPEYFGVCGEVLIELGKRIPVLGVCLGMQGLAHFYGGKVVKAKLPMHGKTSLVRHNHQGLFKGLHEPLEVMRYHSLVVDKKSLPSSLEITARVAGENGNGEIMGLKHKIYPLCGIQFHPESFATEGGKKILENFLI